MARFTDFQLLPTLQQTLKEKDLLTPTEVQAHAIPKLLNGESLVAVSETGSGKTLSYALPVLHRLKVLENEKNPVTQEAHPRALVLVPTRELGEQVTKVFKPFTHTTRLRVRSVLGGTTMEVARRNIQGQFEILVATPGRLLQLIERKLLSLEDIRTLVFDEADQMLDQGFMADAKTIVRFCDRDRQLALFSATVSAPVEDLISSLFSGVEVFRSTGSHQVVPTLKTENRRIVNGKRFPILEKVLAEKVSGGTLIFTNTRDQCDKLYEELTTLGRKCVLYRGEMDKVERRANLKSFRDGQVEIMISTDLASRGLDLEHVGLVINYHLPQEMENYIHRVGRTARAGRQGRVINFITERDEKLMAKVQTLRPRKTN
jgi:ATP-dependent RNA helicase RhlE